ncbi:MAG: iron-only hydrogenase system regulator [Eubacteriales bacterium]|nr:iron-only hydrogenase system regulator [Eubacteriales bacterium]
MDAQTRVALIAIIVESPDSVLSVNELLHEYGRWIIGRMGIPYRERGVSIISVAIDAPQEIISALSGKVGRLDRVSVKTAYSNVVSDGQA